MDTSDEIKALFPDIINGKTHQQLLDEDIARDREAGNHFIDGIKFPWIIQQSNLDGLRRFEVRDDDVFVLTYPRSGTHWVWEIMHLILNDGRDDFDRTFMTAELENTIAPNRSLYDSTTPGYKIYEGMKSPRCMGGHCPERFLPPQVFTKQAKVIYVARNPKDMLTSCHKLTESFEKASESHSLDELLWSISQGRETFGSWFEHVLSYWSHRENPNFLFLKYEDMHKDLRGSVCKLAKHVGKDLSDDVIDTITHRVTFGEMQKTYSALEDKHGEQGKLMTRFQNVAYLRKGKVGDWKNTFTVAQSALFDKMYDLKMRGSGLEFDFVQ